MLRSSGARSAWGEPPKYGRAVASLRQGRSEAMRPGQWRACARRGRAVASRRARGRAKRCAYTGGEPARAHLVRLPPRGWAVSKRTQNIGVRSTWIYKIVLALRLPGKSEISRRKNGCKEGVNSNVNKKMLNTLIVREKNC